MAAEGCVRPAEGMENAAKDLGWKVTVIDTQSAPDKAAAVRVDPIDVAGFDAFMQRYIAALPVERAAVDHVGVGRRQAAPQTADTGTTSAVLTEEQPA